MCLIYEGLGDLQYNVSYDMEIPTKAVDPIKNLYLVWGETYCKLIHLLIVFG